MSVTDFGVKSSQESTGITCSSGMSGAEGGNGHVKTQGVLTFRKFYRGTNIEAQCLVF